MIEEIGLALATVTTCVSLYLLIKMRKAVSVDGILELAEGLTDEVTHDKNMQEKIVAVGVLLGMGIMRGTGLGGKGGSKKLDLGQILMGVLSGDIDLSKILGGLSGKKENAETTSVFS